MVNKLTYASPLFLLTMVLSFFLGFEVGVVSHLSGYAQSIGFSAATGALIMSACMASNLVSKTLYGIMSDHMPPMLVSAIMLSMNICGICLITFSRSVPLLLLGGFLHGCVYSTTTVGLAALFRGQYGNSQYSNPFALGTSMGSLANAIAITMIGVGFDLTDSYHFPFLVCIVISVANICLLGTICRLGSKNRTVEDH